MLQPVQIDHVLLRMPCALSALRVRIDQAHLLVAETGMRHYPIRFHLPPPKVPKTSVGQKLLTAGQV